MERRNNPTPTTVETRDGTEYLTGLGIVFYREGDPSTEFVLWEREDGQKAVERVSQNFADRAIREKHDVRGLVNHDSNKLLGRTGSGTMQIRKTPEGIRYDIRHNPNDTDHRDAKEKASRGDFGGSSFAFKATSRWETEADGTEVRWLVDGDLFDMGPVTYPAYSGTSAGMRAVGDISDVRAERDAWAARNTERARMQREMQEFAMALDEKS